MGEDLAKRVAWVHGDLYRAQYLVASTPLLGPGWEVEELPQGRLLSHAPGLRVSPPLANGHWRLLGEAVETRSGRPSPLEQLDTSAPEDVAEQARHWAGRWSLLGPETLHLDATANLAAFFVRHPELGILVSSSIGLLAQLLHGPDASPSQISPKALAGFPPPRTAVPPVRKLLPSQVLTLSTGAVNRAPVIPLSAGASEPEELRSDDLIEVLRTRLTTAARNLAPLAESGVWVGLTAGLDTRTVLAVCLDAGIAFRTETDDYETMSDADRDLPPRLAQAVGIEHCLVGPQTFDPQRQRLYDRHTWGQVPSDFSRSFASGDGWRWLGSEQILLTGSVFELGRCARYRQFPRPSGPLWPSRSVPPSAKAIMSGLGYWREVEYEASMREWRRWALRHPIEGMDWRDRFHWELRQGGWLSYRQQVFDMAQGRSLPLANSRVILELLLRVPLAQRYFSGGHQYALIERIAPELLRFPVNPPDERVQARRGSLQETTRRARGMSHLVTYPERAGRRGLRRLAGRLEARQIARSS